MLLVLEENQDQDYCCCLLQTVDCYIVDIVAVVRTVVAAVVSGQIGLE